jgi:hypothetical protein
MRPFAVRHRRCDAVPPGIPGCKQNHHKVNIATAIGSPETKGLPASGKSDARDTARMLKTLIGSIDGMVCRCQNDSQWTMEFVSDGCLAVTGHAPEDRLRVRGASMRPGRRGTASKSSTASSVAVATSAGYGSAALGCTPSGATAACSTTPSKASSALRLTAAQLEAQLSRYRD